MSIKVRYFASLKESIGRSEEELVYTKTMSVADVWKQVSNGKEISDNILAAVNMDYVQFDYLVKDADEVAFFPPVTGG
jgi:molybdopterin synthase sulfur carrier subunit